MQLKFRASHDHGTAGEVDALTEKVLTETALLTLEHVGERLQRALVRTGDDAATTTVVEESVNRLLQHPLFVADDDIGCTQFDQALQTVVPVDHTTVEVVEVGGCEAATVQRHQRAQFRWDHRDYGEHHPFRAVAGFEERLHDLEALDDLLRLQFTGCFGEFRTELFGFCFEVDLSQHFADRFSADIGGEGVCAVLVLRVEILFFGHQLAVGQVCQTRLDHDVVFEVEDAFEVTQRHVQH